MTMTANLSDADGGTDGLGVQRGMASGVPATNDGTGRGCHPLIPPRSLDDARASSLAARRKGPASGRGDH